MVRIARESPGDSTVRAAAPIRRDAERADCVARRRGQPRAGAALRGLRASSAPSIRNCVPPRSTWTSNTDAERVSQPTAGRLARRRRPALRRGEWYTARLCPTRRARRAPNHRRRATSTTACVCGSARPVTSQTIEFAAFDRGPAGTGARSRSRSPHAASTSQMSSLATAEYPSIRRDAAELGNRFRRCGAPRSAPDVTDHRVARNHVARHVRRRLLEYVHHLYARWPSRFHPA